MIAKPLGLTQSITSSDNMEAMLGGTSVGASVCVAGTNLQWSHQDKHITYTNPSNYFLIDM